MSTKKMNLHQAKPQPNTISWSQVYFTAEANREPFEDVNIITLKSYFTEKVYDLATQQVGVEDTNKLMRRVRHIIKGGELKVYEHVEVSPTGIRIITDAETVDDDTLWTALDKLAAALDCLEGKCGMVTFGQPTTYKLSDIPSLNLH